eukprot:47202-Pelagomonas_calceolata.AAC.7
MKGIERTLDCVHKRSFACWNDAPQAKRHYRVVCPISVRDTIERQAACRRSLVLSLPALMLADDVWTRVPAALASESSDNNILQLREDGSRRGTPSSAVEKDYDRCCRKEMPWHLWMGMGFGTSGRGVLERVLTCVKHFPLSTGMLCALLEVSTSDCLLQVCSHL